MADHDRRDIHLFATGRCDSHPRRLAERRASGGEANQGAAPGEVEHDTLPVAVPALEERQVGKLDSVMSALSEGFGTHRFLLI